LFAAPELRLALPLDLGPALPSPTVPPPIVTPNPVACRATPRR
jgi:hypothetical protein